MGPLFLCFPLLLEKPLQAAHRPLVPRPRQRQRPALKGISISISATVASRDRFKVGELASALAEINGSASRL
jgi:hypothetical protein